MTGHAIVKVPSFLSVFVLLVPMLFVVGDVDGITGTLSVSGGGKRSIALGHLFAGSSVSYSWTTLTGTEMEVADFYIEDSSSKRYQELTETFQGSGTFEVTIDSSYSMTWDCTSHPAGITIQYSYMVTKVVIESNLTVQISIANNKCPQAQGTDFKVEIVNPNEGEVKLNSVGLHMDWMEPDTYLENLSFDPTGENLQPAEKFTVGIPVEVGNDTRVGLHFYTVNITYDLMSYGNWHPFVWTSGDRSNFYVTDKDTDRDGVPDKDDELPEDPTEVKDTDKDGTGDNKDTFPSDPSASIDRDGDGSPDQWNSGRSQNDSTTGLHLDDLPTDPAASVDSDGDGYPDAWNPNRTAADSSTGLKLDKYPDDPYKWKEEKKSHLMTFIIVGAAVLGTVMLAAISFLVVKRFFKGKEKEDKEAEAEAERVRKEMGEHQKLKELERSGGVGDGAFSNVVRSDSGENLSSVPTTFAEAHALDAKTKRPTTYEDLYGKSAEAAPPESAEGPVGEKGEEEVKERAEASGEE